MPRRPATSPDYLTVRLPSGAGLREAIHAAAAAEDRSANTWVVRAIRAALTRRPRAGKEA